MNYLMWFSPLNQSPIVNFLTYRSRFQNSENDDTTNDNVINSKYTSSLKCWDFFSFFHFFFFFFSTICTIAYSTNITYTTKTASYHTNIRGEDRKYLYQFRKKKNFNDWYFTKLNKRDLSSSTDVFVVKKCFWKDTLL